jgi:cytochrome c-type biogenesis protein CcmH/NrfG
MGFMRRHYWTLAGLALLGLLAGAVPGWSSENYPPGEPKERAIAALEEDLKTDPDNAELWLHLGFAYRKLENISQAQQAFEKVTALSPGEKSAYFMLGLIYESRRNAAAARSAWTTYLSLETDPEKRAVAVKHIHHLSQ